MVLWVYTILPLYKNSLKTSEQFSDSLSFSPYLSFSISILFFFFFDENIRNKIKILKLCTAKWHLSQRLIWLNVNGFKCNILETERKDSLKKYADYLICTFLLKWIRSIIHDKNMLMWKLVAGIVRSYENVVPL